MEKTRSDQQCGCGVTSGGGVTSGCAEVARERNRYFTGKFMTARDFAGEQAYVLSRHRLHNRLLHGWGIVCGLRVVRHPNEKDCGDGWVVVRPGVALDCCGREIILDRDTPFELPLPTVDADANADPRFLLCLRYGELGIEPVPALDAEGDCDPRRREANRVREIAEITTCRLNDVEGDCWRWPDGGPDSPCRDDCDDEVPGPGGSCLESECPCGGCVPLALIVPSADGGFEIDLDGRRQLPPPPEYLTHVVGINWPHGGKVSLSQLGGAMDGRLEVRFDRRIRVADGDATGINEQTFQVQCSGVQLDLEFVDGTPSLDDGGCAAVFQIEPGFLEGRRNLAGKMIYVTLHGDFILDCHDNPVDADYLAARLPSGNGIPGGTFRSWFEVTSDSPASSEEQG